VSTLHLSEHNERIRRHFDGLAESYLRRKAQNRYYHAYLIRWCRSVLPPDARVLEIGSGRGDVLEGVDPGVGLGIDLSAEMVRRAREEHEPCGLRSPGSFSGRQCYDRRFFFPPAQLIFLLVIASQVADRHGDGTCRIAGIDLVNLLLLGDRGWLN